MGTLVKAFLQIVLIGYVLIALLFWTLSDGVLFQPPNKHPQIMPGTIQIPLANQQNFAAIYLPHPGARYTILFSHGNAEDLATLYPFLKLLTEHGYAVFAYDYPGYGQSTGKPSEASTYQAINAAY
ncbi:MAG TPA: alpha/beta hydrolase, partial [Candidatus Berkiella sp.]|nr:alpha/beta hydrolase [Candidatus Berkiella sp.]